MEANKVDQYIMMNAKYFEGYQLNMIKERLLQMDDSKWTLLNSVSLNDPTTTLIISILGGGLGIDRFLIGDTGMGIGKLLTAGGCGVWAIIDWFLIQGATREKNFNKVMSVL